MRLPCAFPTSRAALLSLAAVVTLVQAGPARAQGEGREPLAVGAPAPPAPADVLMLRLRDGGVRFGAIAGHDATHLEFTLLATGGVVRVPWTMLDPVQANELLARYGYVDTAAEEVYVDAERLVLTKGGTVEGVILSREGDFFLVKSEGNLQQVPKSQVSAVESGLRLPALDVYSAEELYNQFAAEADPNDAAAQWALAEQCERIYAFDRALAHYERARALDPTLRADELVNLLPRIAAKAQQAAQLEYLRDADRMRKRGQWDRALEALVAFEGLFPSSPLAEDAKKQQARLLLAREEAAKEYVKKRWLYWMKRLARDLAQEPTLAAARAHVDERLSEEIQKAVLADLQKEISKEAQLEQVKQLFAARKKVRYDSSTYGNGTWLIGEEAALKGSTPSDAPATPVNDVDRQRQELEQRIKQFLKNQQVASRGRKAEAEEDLAQTFWESFSAGDRERWLISYYAENSGDLEVRVRPDLIPCRTCGGRGALEVLLTGGGGAPDQGSGGGRGGRSGGRGASSGGAGDGMQLQKCPTCQGLGIVRRVHFR